MLYEALDTEVLNFKRALALFFLNSDWEEFKYVFGHRSTEFWDGVGSLFLMNDAEKECFESLL